MKIISSLIFLIVFLISCSDATNSDRDKEFIQDNIQLERTSKILKNGN